MEIFIKIVHVIACFFLMIVVLLQAGKGGGMGIAFGSAGAQQVFGGRGAGNFLEKLTAGFAGLFMLTSISLAYMASVTESSRLQEHAAERAKQDEARKKKEAEQNKKAEEEARKALDAKKAAEGASTPATSTPTDPSTVTPPPAPGAGTPPQGTPVPSGTAPAAPTTTPANPAQAPPQ